MQFEDGLTPKKRKVLELYHKNGMNNATAAYMAVFPEASKASARSSVSLIINSTAAQIYLDKLGMELREKSALTSEFIVDNLVELIKRCMQSTPVKDEKGQETGEYTFQAMPAVKALELAAKLARLLGPEVQHKLEAVQFNLQLPPKDYEVPVLPKPLEPLEVSVN